MTGKQFLKRSQPDAAAENGPAPESAEMGDLPPEAAALLALQRAVGNAAVGTLLRQGGNRLPDGTRRGMEQRLGADLEDVQVHTDAEAADQAQRLGARAFTAGNRIAFAEGAYAPGTSAGDELLAHELAHVAQQQQTGHRTDPRRISPASHPSERQAAQAARGEPTPLDTAPAGIARYAPGEEPAAPAPAAAATPAAPEPADPAEVLLRTIGLADTIARGYLDTHYNDIQDALRDFEESATDQIAAMDGAPSGLWSLLSLVDTVNTIVSSKFPIGRIGKVITGVISESSPVRSALQTIMTTKVTNERDAAKDRATELVRGFGQQSGSAQAAAFKRAREALRGQLFALAAGSADERALLETASAEAVVTEQLGIPSPDSTSLYRPIRLQLEIEFADWLTEHEQRKSNELAVTLGLHESVYAPGRKAARERVDADVEARAGAALGVDAAVEQAYEFEDQEVNPVLAGPEFETIGIDPELETDLVVMQSVKLAETRARGFMNTNYNAVQDAVRDFVVSALNQIESMEEEPGDYALAHLLFDTAATAVSILFPPSALAITIGLALKSAVQTFAAEAEAVQKENRREQAIQTVRGFSRGMTNAQAAAFAEGERILGAELVSLAFTDETARGLLEAGDADSLDKVINGQLGVPNPEKGGTYLKIREPLEVKFAEWYVLQTEVKPRYRQYGAAEHLLKPAREAARERARMDAQARSALGLQFGEEDEAPVPPLMPVGPLTLEDSRRASALQQAMTLIDTRARGFLNTHYDSVQDAIRDFEDSAQERLDSMDEPAADLSGLQSTLFSTAAGKISGAFTEEAVGSKMNKALSLASTVASAAQSHSMAVSAKASSKSSGDLKSAAKKMMQTLMKDMSNFQAAVFERGQQSVGKELNRLVATDAGLRARLEAFADQTESGMRLEIDDLITNRLGISNPDTTAMYLKVRTALETEFFGWAARSLTEARMYAHDWLKDFDIDPQIEARSRAAAAERAQEAAKRRSEG